MKHKSLLIFGGTFDPIHLGHLQIAAAVQQHFHFSSFIFLPCKVPVLKPQAQANSDHRLKLLQCALTEFPIEHALIDAREINRDSPSYMVTTLADFRQEQGDTVSISLLMGEDVFANLPKWHKWKEILQLCNILLIKRQPATPLTQPLKDLLTQQVLVNDQDLLKNRAGGIFLFDAGSFAISSTAIRNSLKKGYPSKDLPPGVAAYLAQNKLY